MSFSLKITGHADDAGDRVLYELAVRLIRKAREVGASDLRIEGGFAAGPMNADTGIDPPEVPFVGCQVCETDGWPTPMDPRETCPSCGASYDPEAGPAATSGESVDATVQVPAPDTMKAVAHPPKA